MLALAVGGLIGGTRVVVEAMDTDDGQGSSVQVSTAGASLSHDPNTPSRTGPLRSGPAR